MGRGFMYEIQSLKSFIGNYHAAMLFDNPVFFGKVRDLSGKEKEDAQKKILKHLQKCGAEVDFKKKKFKLTVKVKENYFSTRYKEFIKKAKKITLREFSTSDMSSLKLIMDDTWADGGFSDEYAEQQSLDRWIREAGCGTYYIGNVVAME